MAHAQNKAAKAGRERCRCSLILGLAAAPVQGRAKDESSEWSKTFTVRGHPEHVKLDFPVTISGSVSRCEVRGKMNGGGQELRIRTGDGSIHIEKL